MEAPVIKTLGIDLETYSSVDIGECGVHKYVESEDFDILLFGYSINGEPAVCVDFASGEKLPKEIYEAVYDPAVEKTAFNAAFERTCIGRYFGRYCEPKQWSCTMVLSSSCGLPMSLAGVGNALGLSEDQAKMKEGKDLIRYFCMPCKATKANGHRTRNLPSDAPDKWDVFKRYNIRDVDVETLIRQKLLKWRADYSEDRFWHLDQQINDRGIKVEKALAENAIWLGNSYRDNLLVRASEISGLDNPNSTAQIKEWLEEQEGIEVVSLNKKAIAEVVAGLSTEEAKEFMKLRTEFSKSSTKKYDAVLRCACEDSHVRGCFQFDGAGRTGRFAGRLVQLQNLPQNHLEDLDAARDLVLMGDLDTFQVIYPDVQDTLSQLIRTVLIPEEGHQFIVADFSAIEARVIAWIANQEWRLETFRNGGDIYCASASQMFKVPVEKHGQNSHLRQKGKIAELALGYGGSVGALSAFGAKAMGMSDEDMAATVDMWRDSSPRIVALWKALNTAAVKCVTHKKTTVSTIGNIRFDLEDGVLWMTIPSGRRIAYWGASMGEDRWGRPSLTYMGQNQTTHKWEKIETFGGKLTENCIAKGTPVLTLNGLKPIEEVSDKDLLWDGVSWVHHEGLIDKGIQETILANGIRLTPDHKILTTMGWRKADEAEGLNWVGVQLLPRPRCSNGVVISRAKCKERVYDILNCGKRHRFCVYDEAYNCLRIVSNCVQATARDCLKEVMLRLNKEGFDIRGHVHDEVIITEPIDGRSVEDVCNLMGEEISWAPGLPLRADGYSCTSYRKD